MIKPAANLANANGWKTGAAEITDVRLETADGTPSVTLKGGEACEVAR